MSSTSSISKEEQKTRKHEIVKIKFLDESNNGWDKVHFQYDNRPKQRLLFLWVEVLGGWLYIG